MVCWVAATPTVRVSVTPIIATRLHTAEATARRRNALCLRPMASFAPVSGMRKPATTEATAGIRNTNACAMIIQLLWLIDHARATKAVWPIGKPCACRICMTPVRCWMKRITITARTAAVNEARTAVERSVRKMAATIIDMARPSAKPSARNSMSEVKIGSPGSTQMVSCRITSGSA